MIHTLVAMGGRPAPFRKVAEQEAYLMMRTITAALLFMLIAPASSPAGQIGTAAPNFSLTDLNGNVVTLEQFKRKAVLLNFWAPWCIPCREELPELDRLNKEYGKDGFQVIGISVDDSQEDVGTFLRKVPVSFPILLDGGDVNEAYLVTGLPTGFIVGRDGIIRYVHRGFGKEFLPMYEKEIEELLNRP
jgi:thiol-disulfide isomerase/thioredoxin